MTDITNSGEELRPLTIPTDVYVLVPRRGEKPLVFLRCDVFFNLAPVEHMLTLFTQVMVSKAIATSSSPQNTSLGVKGLKLDRHSSNVCLLCQWIKSRIIIAKIKPRHRCVFLPIHLLFTKLCVHVSPTVTHYRVLEPPNSCGWIQMFSIGRSSDSFATAVNLFLYMNSD